MDQPFSVLIADDHAFSAAGLQRVLEETGFLVLDSVGTGIDAIASARASQPDLAVLDYDMPDGTGLDVLKEIRRWSPKTRVAILTGRTSKGLLSTLQAAGVDGLFVKSTDPAQIAQGLIRVAQGTQVVDCEVDDTASLSSRELEVLRCIADGLTNSGTAAALSISVKTVESHRASLMRKMRVHSTASLLVRAIQDGLITP